MARKGYTSPLTAYAMGGPAPVAVATATGGAMVHPVRAVA